MRPSLALPSHSPRDTASDVPVARQVVARAPTRIDFGGGWTDVPPYPERDGGFVCNIAIARYAHVHLDATVPGDPGDLLVAAALRRAAATARAHLTSDFPVGAGLGGSSAAGIALQAALAHMRGERPEPEVLVLRSREVEVEELGIAGGWQDHYAAAYGGALALDFGMTTHVERIELSEDASARLVRRCLLLYTGETRISGENIIAVLDAYVTGDRRVTSPLARMASLAREMAASLRSGAIDALGAQIAEHWEHQRSLHPAITTNRIDTIVTRAAAAGALGAKALGASGGGCVVVVTPEDPEPVRAALEGLGTFMPYSLDVTGAFVQASA